MCKWASAIVTRTKKILFNPWTDHHEDLITLFGLRDDNKFGHFVRVEFSPKDMDKAHLLDTYELTVDERETPEWFDSKLREKIIKYLTAEIKKLIIAKAVKFITGEVCIVAPGAKIEKMDCCRVPAMCGGTLTAMRGGTLTEMWGGTLTEMWGGTLTAMRGGTLTAMWGGTLTEMRGGTLTEMRGGTLTAMDGRYGAKILDDKRTPENKARTKTIK